MKYEVIFDELAAINEETQTIEFKAELNPVDVAKEAVAMANAIGGIIVVGINDPVKGIELSASAAMGLRTDEPACRRLRSQILSRVYPAIPVEVYGYSSVDGREMLAINVGESIVAPHEFVHERGRFPTRRGTQIDYLSLGEIENLIRRRDSASSNNGEYDNAYTQLAFDRTTGLDFLAVRLGPLRAKSRVMIRREQVEIESQVCSLPGLKSVKAQTLADGILFREPFENLPGSKGDESWSRRCYVRSDGMLELRLPIEPRISLQYQVFRTLGNAFALSGWLLRLLGEGPLVRGAFIYSHVRSQDRDRFEIIGGSDEIPLKLDLSRQTFSQAFTATLLYALRSAGESENPETIEPELRQFWDDNYGNRSSFAEQFS